MYLVIAVWKMAMKKVFFGDARAGETRFKFLKKGWFQHINT